MDVMRYVIRSSVYTITRAHSREYPTHADTLLHTAISERFEVVVHYVKSAI